MLKQRLITGFSLAGLLILATIYAPPLLVVAIILLLTGVGIVEFNGLLAGAGIGHQRSFAFFSGLLYVLAICAGYVSPWLDPELAGVGTLFVIFAALFLHLLVFSKHPRPLEVIGGTFLAILYVAFLSSFFIHLLFFDGSGNGNLFIIFLISVVKSSDIGAYFSGRWFGTHKFIPRVSPNKTWEGVAGGILLSIAVSLIWFLASRGDLRVVRLSMLDFCLLGFLLPWLGIFGDLSESMLKRQAQMKDSGTWIHGMGGVLDVVDSLLFAAPALYLYARLFQG